MTLEMLIERLEEHGYKTEDITGNAFNYQREGIPYPCYLIVKDKDGTYVRWSQSYQDHRRAWLEDIEDEDGRTTFPSFVKKRRICGDACRYKVANQCEFCLKYRRKER